MKHQKDNKNCPACAVKPVRHNEFCHLIDGKQVYDIGCDGLMHNMITGDGIILGDGCDKCSDICKD